MNKFMFIEVQSRGIEHLIFNSSILTIVTKIFCGASFELYAEKTHAELLCKNNLVTQYNLYMPKGHGKLLLLKLIFSELIICLKIKKRKPDCIIYLSVTPFGIIFSNILFKKTKKIYFLHGFLELLYSNKHKLWNYDYWVRYALNINNNNTVYIALRNDIKNKLNDLLLYTPVETINLPYPLYDDAQITSLPEHINFGAIGFGYKSKNTASLFLLEEKLLIYTNELTLHYIGKIPADLIPNETTVKIHGGAQPLQEKEFNYYIKELQYALFFYSSNTYRIIPSGAVFDALTNLKPVIAVRNSYFEYIFLLMGNIGYLCDSIEEMANCMIKIINDKDTTVYRQQQNNIRNGLKYFSIEYVGNQLRDIFAARNIFDHSDNGKRR